MPPSSYDLGPAYVAAGAARAKRWGTGGWDDLDETRRTWTLEGIPYLIDAAVPEIERQVLLDLLHELDSNGVPAMPRVRIQERLDRLGVTDG